MNKLQATINDLRSRGIADDLSANPITAYEWLTGQSDLLVTGFQATLPGHYISSGQAKFGTDVVHFVSLHEDSDFHPNSKPPRVEPTADNCVLCLKITNIVPSTTFAAVRIAQALAEDA